ncbi:MAG: DUF4830 domain-containing protein [Oscillospiraceae bacterium]
MKHSSHNKPRSGGCIMAGALLLAAAGVWGAIKLSEKDNAIPGATNGERIAFINACGWQTEATHCDLTEVRIPTNFDEVYEEYNNLQILQGFDLRPYRAHSVKKYTYLITDFSAHGSDSAMTDIYANLLVENGSIIGADISSAEAGGLVTVLYHEDE